MKINIWPFSVIRRMKEREHLLQWLARTAFWEANPNDPDWVKKWKSSHSRAQLVAWGIISGKDDYR